MALFPRNWKAWVLILASVFTIIGVCIQIYDTVTASNKRQLRIDGDINGHLSDLDYSNSPAINDEHKADNPLIVNGLQSKESDELSNVEEEIDKLMNDITEAINEEKISIPDDINTSDLSDEEKYRKRMDLLRSRENNRN